MPIKAAIWDLDGTILDTEPLYFQAESEVVHRYVKDANLLEVVPKLLGTVARDSARILIDTYHLPLSIDEYIEIRDQSMNKLVHNVPFLPGVEENIREFARRGISQAVATSSARAMFNKKKASTSAFFAEFFPVTVCGDEVEHGKPAPDIFLRAASLLGVDPSDCVVFEDAPAGAKGAKTARMQAVVIKNDHTERKAYDEAGADLLVKSWVDFDVGQYLNESAP